MTSTGIWMAVTQLGVILYLKIDLLVINQIFGTAEAGRYSVILQQSTLIRSMAAALAGVLTPALTAFYARNDIEGLMRIAVRGVKFIGLALAIPLGLLCGLSRPFLGWWLGPEFTNLSPLMWLMMGHLAFNLSVIP